MVPVFSCSSPADGLVCLGLSGNFAAFYSRHIFRSVLAVESSIGHFAVQDIETVEGLLFFTPDGSLSLREDYHNHPESRRLLERLLEIFLLTGPCSIATNASVTRHLVELRSRVKA